MLELKNEIVDFSNDIYLYLKINIFLETKWITFLLKQFRYISKSIILFHFIFYKNSLLRKKQ